VFSTRRWPKEKATLATTSRVLVDDPLPERDPEQVVTMPGAEPGSGSITYSFLVSAFDFSPDGSRMVVGGADGYVRVWDMRPERRTQEQVAALVAQHIPWRFENGRLVPVDR